MTVPDTGIFLLNKSEASSSNVPYLHSTWNKTLIWEPSLSLRMNSSPLYIAVVEYIKTSAVSDLMVIFLLVMRILVYEEMT